MKNRNKEVCISSVSHNVLGLNGSLVLVVVSFTCGRLVRPYTLNLFFGSLTEFMSTYGLNIAAGPNR